MQIAEFVSANWLGVALGGSSMWGVTNLARRKTSLVWDGPKATFAVDFIVAIVVAIALALWQDRRAVDTLSKAVLWGAALAVVPLALIAFQGVKTRNIKQAVWRQLGLAVGLVICSSLIFLLRT